jgi:hypothetical protein
MPTYTMIPVIAPNTGAFQVAHGLGAMPKAGFISQTSDGRIRWEEPRYDATWLYLSASDVDLTAEITIW